LVLGGSLHWIFQQIYLHLPSGSIQAHKAGIFPAEGEKTCQKVL